MIRKLTQFVAMKWREMVRESAIPAPPFKACKRTATIMYGLWYGRITPGQARMRALDWGFTDEQIDGMIADSTVEPSYWSQHTLDDADHLSPNIVE